MKPFHAWRHVDDLAASVADMRANLEALADRLRQTLHVHRPALPSEPSELLLPASPACRREALPRWLRGSSCGPLCCWG